MNDNQRLVLFFLGCVPTRLLYAVVQNSKYGIWWLNILVGITFIYKWATWSGEKGAFGGVLWWNNMRFIHGIIYLVSAIYPILLYIDIVIGIIAKVANYYLKN
jgi:hypothetical protein